MDEATFRKLAKSITEKVTAAKGIDDAWSVYAQVVLEPSDPSDKQRRDAKHAFYQGAEAMYMLVMRAPELGEVEGEKHIKRLHDELATFALKTILGIQT